MVENLGDAHGESHHAGLGVPGLIQNPLAVLEADLFDVKVQFRPVQHGPELGVGLVQVGTHTRVLAALSGIQKRNAHPCISFTVLS